MTIFEKAIKWFEKIFQHLFNEIEETIFPFTVNFLNQIKKAVDSKLATQILEFIPNEYDFNNLQKLKKVLNDWLPEHDLISEIDTPEIINVKLTALFSQLDLTDKKQRSKQLSTIGAEIIQELAEQEINYATAVMQLEFYYKKIYREDKE